MNVRPDGKKQCSRCREVLVADGNFYPSKKNDGWSGYCIPCTKIKAVEWQKANPDRKAAIDAPVSNESGAPTEDTRAA